MGHGHWNEKTPCTPFAGKNPIKSGFLSLRAFPIWLDPVLLVGISISNTTLVSLQKKKQAKEVMPLHKFDYFLGLFWSTFGTDQIE